MKLPTQAGRATLLLAATMCAGCSVQSHSNGDGKGDNVKIATPFGGMQVKSDQTNAGDIGLTVYPGAVPTKDKNSDSANVSMSFGDFKLKVLTANYVTGDSADKVFAFYRPQLSKYGDVLECDHNTAVGSVTATSGGLTCDNDEHGRGHANIHTGVTNSGDHELRVGDSHKFRVVSVEPKNGKTEIGLVYLELPHGNSKGSVD